MILIESVFFKLSFNLVFLIIVSRATHHTDSGNHWNQQFVDQKLQHYQRNIHGDIMSDAFITEMV